MLNIFKNSVVVLAVVLLVFLPRESYASEDQYGRAHHGHGFHSHSNPDLTLVTGMDNIDSRVLIAAGPDQTPEVIDQ